MRWVPLVLGLWFATVGAARLEPEAPGLGQRATLHLEPAPADSTQWPVGIGVLVEPTADPAVFTVRPLRVGEVGIAWASEAGPDTLGWDVPTRIAEPAPERLRPLREVGDLGPNWWPTILVAAALVLPLLVWLVRRWRRRPPRRAAFELPSEPPHETALRRLGEIAASGWIEAGEFERVYVEASHALRSYVAGRYRVRALDWTSQEVTEGLRRAGYDAPAVAPVGDLLREADTVKFAADRPTSHSAEEWMRRAEEFIRGTAVEPVYSTPEALAAVEAFQGGHR